MMHELVLVTIDENARQELVDTIHTSAQRKKKRFVKKHIKFYQVKLSLGAGKAEGNLDSAAAFLARSI